MYRFNDQIFADLVQLLMVKQDALPDGYSPENPIHPCWIGSSTESQFAFEQIVSKLHQWLKDVAIQIYNSREKNSLSWVRFSGNNRSHQLNLTRFQLK